jgi:hypothetical protein
MIVVATLKIVSHMEDSFGNIPSLSNKIHKYFFHNNYLYNTYCAVIVSEEIHFRLIRIHHGIA